MYFSFVSKRFDKVHDNAKNIWHYQQYKIVREYFHRASLIPPFNIFEDIYKLFFLVLNLIQKKRKLRMSHQMKVFSMYNRRHDDASNWYYEF